MNDFSSNVFVGTKISAHAQTALAAHFCGALLLLRANRTMARVISGIVQRQNIEYDNIDRIQCDM
jgi:hypothetical protein